MAGLRHLHAQLLLLLTHRPFVYLVGNRALEALRELGSSLVALVVLVVLLALGVDALADLLAHVSVGAVHGHEFLDPFVIGDGNDFLLLLEQRDGHVDRLHDLVHVGVQAGAFEREGAGLPHLHAVQALVESRRHEVLAGRIGATVGGKARDDLAILLGVNLELAALLRPERVRVARIDPYRVLPDELADLAVDFLFIGLEGLDRERDRAVVLELIGWLRQDVELELIGLAALDGRIGDRRWRESRNDTVLVERGRYEHVGCLRGNSRVEVLDAERFGNDLRRRLVLNRTDAHLAAERIRCLVERIGHFGTRCGHIERDVAVGSLFLDYFHVLYPPCWVLNAIANCNVMRGFLSEVVPLVHCKCALFHKIWEIACAMHAYSFDFSDSTISTRDSLGSIRSIEIPEKTSVSRYAIAKLGA